MQETPTRNVSRSEGQSGRTSNRTSRNLRLTLEPGNVSTLKWKEAKPEGLEALGKHLPEVTVTPQSPRPSLMKDRLRQELLSAPDKELRHTQSRRKARVNRKWSMIDRCASWREAFKVSPRPKRKRE
jgi:hypothetical protein